MAEDTSQAPKDLIGFLDFYLVKKAPFQLPEGVKEFIVKFGPWITVILAIPLFFLLLVALGLGTFVAGLGLFFSPYGAGYAAGFGLTMIVVLVQFVLMIAALPGLFARRMSGWKLLLYGQLLSIVVSLLNLNILGALIGGLIGLYLLFQVREKYH